MADAGQVPSPAVASSDVFGPGGKLSTAHPSYERREGQERMAVSVEEALRQGKRLLIEAGTGVGKTLAYLVPAALSGRRVIVSTGTKNLQDQILDKDLPFVVAKLGIDVKATAVKGRDNYLCLRRFKEHDREPLLPTIQESEAYESLKRWARTTQTGERGEAAGVPEEVSFWRRINARADTCTGTRCEDYEACFLTKVRRRAAESQIVVVNHHLFFADLALREDAFGKVLPDYDAVIFDEAHLVEEIATLFFGVSCSSARVLELADDAERTLRGSPADAARGSRWTSGPRSDAESWAADEEGLPGPRAGRGPNRWAGAERGPGEGPPGTDPSRRTLQGRGRGRRGRAGVSSCREADDLRLAGAAFFEPLAGAPGRRTFREAVHGTDFEPRCENLLRALGRLRAAAESHTPLTDESVAVERRCREVAAQIEFIARQDDERFVYWLETKGRSVVLSASPVDLSEVLSDTLFSNLHAAILTSATLSVDGGFSFVRERLGLDGAEEQIVPSPFDYASQAVLYLPSAMPEPRSDGYAERMLREIESLVGISGGRAFLLFTSHGELRRVERALRGRTRLPILVQGDKPRARLLEEFRDTEGAILLGAASFWHGVDVPGQALSLVVIDRIPFDVPNDPLVAARIGRIRALGGDPFTEYQVPCAAIELKQGLGRLIRSRSDRGILAVLDARLRTRGYGRDLLKAMPPFTIVSDIEEVRRFFAGAPRS